MKKSGFLLCLLLVLNQAGAQENTGTEPLFSNTDQWPRFQAGFSPMAMAANIVKLEFYARVADAHYLGLQGGPLFGSVDVDGFWRQEIERQNLRGFYARMGHRFHLVRISSDLSLFLDHGPVFYQGRLPYTTKGWVSYEEDGLQFYREGDIQHYYTSQRIGYDAGVGLQFWLGFMYLDLSLSFQYLTKISTEPPPEGYRHANIFNGVDYEGARPLPAVRFGFLID